jgi:hypothetical protein
MIMIWWAMCGPHLPLMAVQYQVQYRYTYSTLQYGALNAALFSTSTSTTLLLSRLQGESILVLVYQVRTCFWQMCCLPFPNDCTGTCTTYLYFCQTNEPCGRNETLDVHPQPIHWRRGSLLLRFAHP